MCARCGYAGVIPNDSPKVTEMDTRCSCGCPDSCSEADEIYGVSEDDTVDETPEEV